MKIPFVAVPILMLLGVSNAQAHVRVFPLESRPGATETYTMYVPTEGKSATVSVELDVPDGVNIVSIDGPPDAFVLRKNGTRIEAIAWKASIPPGENQAFRFVASNPGTPGQIAWKAHQQLADGTRNDWVEAPGTKRPASITILTVSRP
jgi:uncharacterized protein YcnI